MSNWSRDLYGVKTLSEVSSSAAISSATLPINLNLGTVFYVSLNSDITSIAITNISSGSTAFTIVFTADGTPRSITWGASIMWPGGAAPTLTSTNNKKDIFSFMTLNGGTNWYGFIGGQNL